MWKTSPEAGFSNAMTSGLLKNAMTGVTSNLCREMNGSSVPRMCINLPSMGSETSS